MRKLNQSRTDEITSQDSALAARTYLFWGTRRRKQLEAFKRTYTCRRYSFFFYIFVLLISTVLTQYPMWPAPSEYYTILSPSQDKITMEAQPEHLSHIIHQIAPRHSHCNMTMANALNSITSFDILRYHSTHDTWQIHESGRVTICDAHCEQHTSRGEPPTNSRSTSRTSYGRPTKSKT
jgi:hypothetical protein